MTSIDLKKTYREHYTAKQAPSIVEVPKRPFLMIDGNGDPNTAEVIADHEIYLSDPRKTDTAKLRTIIRQPFASSPSTTPNEGQLAT